MKLVIELRMPEKKMDEKEKAVYRKRTPEERVRECLELIDSGYHSRVEWLLINKVFRTLSARKSLSKRQKSILEMIRPVMARYGYHGVGSNDER